MAPNEESAPPPAVVPARDLQAAGSAYERFARILRERGCKCPLMWNGVVCVPATVCDLQGVGPDRHVCKVLQTLPPVPETGSTSDTRLLGVEREVSHAEDRPLDAVQSAGGD